MAFRYLCSTPDNAFRTLTPGRNCFTSKFLMALNPKYSFDWYSDYLRKRFDDLSEPGSKVFDVVKDFLDSTSYKNASFYEAYNDYNEDRIDKFNKKSFHYGATIARPAYFYSKNRMYSKEKEYKIDIWVEVKGALVGKHENGGDIVRLMCKMNFYVHKPGFDD